MALALTIVSAVAFLAIAIVAVVSRSRTRLALPLALMSVALFAYTSSDAVAIITENPRWDWIGYAFAALLAIPTFELAIGFVGMAKPLRSHRLAFALYFVGLAFATASPFVVRSWAEFPASELWSVLMLAGLLPAVFGAGWLLYRHAQKSPPEERARTRLLVWTLLLGVGGNVVDLVFIAAGSPIRLAALPLATSSVLVAALVLRARMLEGVSALTLFNGGVIAVLAIVAQVVVYAWAGTRLAFLAFGTLVVMLAVLAAVRPLLTTMSEHRARMKYLATLGRFAEQMAHDLRNPLAAIQGAAQFLQEEHRQGRSLDPHLEFLDLIVERVDRLDRVIKDYQRMGRVELRPERVDVNQLVQRVVAGVAAAVPGVRIQLELASAVPSCALDRDLITVALENVLRNGIEAMPDGGELTISTHHDAQGVTLRARDSGQGMDARTRELALEDFYTTKDGGSGLGLPFVARVIEAHGGSIDLDSQEGAGTTVGITLPCAPL